MSRKPPHDREPPHQPEAQPGTAGPCESIDPMNLPEEPKSAKPARGKPRPAPAPGVPMPAEDYERLKQRAKHGPAPRAEHAQEDKPKKK